MAQDLYLSVIVPAYQEEERIAATLQTINAYLSKQNYGYEIIVVNDGSKDRTAETVRKLIPRIANLRLIDNKINHGKGYVVRQGMLAGRGQYRLFTDSDNSTPIEEIEKLLPFFEQGYDIVIGSRQAEGAKLDPPQPLFRRFVGRGWWFLTSIFAGTWMIADTQCGFKIMTSGAAQIIFPLCTIDRFAFDAEILAVARIKKFKIKEVGVLWRNDPRSTVKFKSMVKMFFDLLKISFNIVSAKYDK